MKTLKTDEYLECLNSLKFTSHIMSQIEGDLSIWKWVIISFHNAMQNILVLSLQGSNGLLTLKNKSANDWLNSYRKGLPYKEEKLDNFLGLYGKIKSDVHLRNLYSQSFLSSEKHDLSLETLNSIRNEFVHYGPKFWLLEVSGLPNIFLDCLEIALFQCVESGTIGFSEKRPQEPVVEELKKLRNFFSKIKETYENST